MTKIEKSSVNPFAAFDQVYEITIIQFKSKKKLNVHPLNFEKVFKDNLVIHLLLVRIARL